MNKPSTVKTSPDPSADQHLRRDAIADGKLVLRQRGGTGAVLPKAESLEGVVRKTIREELRRT